MSHSAARPGEDVHVDTARADPATGPRHPLVRLPVAEQEVARRGAYAEPAARQAEGGDRPARAPRHAATGGDLPEHGGRLPLRTGPQAEAGPLLARRLHLPQRSVAAASFVQFLPTL